MEGIIKTLVLASGGIDSIMLLYFLTDRGQKVDVMYFSYGQPADSEEFKILNNHVESLNISLKDRGFKPINIIKVPLDLSWSKSGMLNNEINNDYVEMRNLIFLSNALSYAQSNKYDNIAIGFIKDYFDEAYPDTSIDFVNNFRKISNSIGIELLTPFFDWNKLEIVNLAINRYGLDIDCYDKTFWFCNTPKKLNSKYEPCGECFKCKYVREMVDYFKN